MDVRVLSQLLEFFQFTVNNPLFFPFLTNCMEYAVGLGSVMECGSWSVEIAWRDRWVSPAVASRRWDWANTRALGGRPQALNLLWGARFYRLAPEVPLFRRIPTRPEVFLRLPGVSELLLCAWTHLNLSLLPYSLVWWGEWQIHWVKSAFLYSAREVQIDLIRVTWLVFCLVRKYIYDSSFFSRVRSKRGFA